MEAYDVYRDISQRTGGDIYIGVVGPVRTGKSTLIAKMTEELILPNIKDENEKARLTDELPQSGAGRMIMTTQPKFVPSEAVTIQLDEKANFRIRMVDCVGYLVEGAEGHLEDGAARMVSTPWFDHPVPFAEAAEVGTSKVISDHANVGIVMTTDGSIADIPRENYVLAEERVIRELKELGKPFLILLNSAHPDAPETQRLSKELQEKYGSAVLLLNVLQFQKEDMNRILSDLLYEFPVQQVNVQVSPWVCALPSDHWLMEKVLSCVRQGTDPMHFMRDYAMVESAFSDQDFAKRVQVEHIDLGKGEITLVLDIKEPLFYQVLGEACGCEIEDDRQLIAILKDLVDAKKKYSQLEDAMKTVDQEGYGIVVPGTAQMSLEEPELVQQGNKFGVRLKASAPSLHIIKVDVDTEVQPIVGTEQQSEELIEYMMKEFKTQPGEIWKTDIFGKPLSEIVREGLTGKINGIPADAKEKMRDTLERMVNEGDGGMLCILL